MKNSPFQMGITGGIGAGKSIVSKIFSTLGVPVYNADDNAKILMNSDPSLISEIQKLFGSEAYVGGSLNRTLLAQKAFRDKTLLAKLNAVVHPAVARDYTNWIARYQSSKLTLKEAALLFETGSNVSLDGVILVSAPEEERIRRVVKRDSHRREEDVKAIIANQMSEAEKEKRADYIIYNDGKHSLLSQVINLHDKLMSQIDG